VVLGCIGPALEDRIQRAVRALSLTVERERKGRAVIDNFQSNIYTLTVEGVDTLVAQLAAQFRGDHPMELPKAVEPALSLIRAKRAHQLIDRDVKGTKLLPSGTVHSVSLSATPSVA
jgi:hypothetical protein